MSSWDLMMRSFRVLRRDKQLVLFPILSAIAAIAISVPFVLALFAAGEPRWSVSSTALCLLWYFCGNTVVIFFNCALAASARTYSELEERLFSSNEIEGVALRYGFFYGAKTWYHPGEAAANMVMRQQNPVVGKGEGVSSFVHVDDAAIATAKALTAEPGLYNVVDDDPSPQSVWLRAFARFVDAPEPPQMSEAEVRALAGEDAVYYATKLSGASNAKAKRVLSWQPRRLEWLKA